MLWPRPRSVRRLIPFSVIFALVLAACTGAQPATSGAASPAPGAAATTAASTKPIRIAVVGPMSGPFAPSTTGFQNSATVGVEQINAKGGINGRKLELVIKDDQFQPNMTAQLVQELNEDGVNIFILVYTAGVQALQPTMAAGKYIVFTANPPELQNDPKQLPYDFNFFPPNRFATEAIAAAAKKKGQKTWATVTDTTNQFQEYIKFIQAKASDAGAKIVLDQTFDPATTDFSSVAKKVKDSGADAVMLFAAGAAIPRFLQAVKATGITADIYGGYGGAAADLSTAPQDVLANQYFFASNATNLLGPTGTPLVKEYGDAMAQLFWSKYGKKSNVGGGVTYDLFQAIVYAIGKAGGDDPKKMRAELEKTADSGGIALTAPSVKYKFSATDHGGFPADQVRLAKTVANPDWPGFFPAAP